MLPRVDIISGGFPCQDISNAGKRTGIAGARSGLWGAMVRAIRMVRPRYAVVENVAALLGRGMGRVLGDLAESGYHAEWDCLPAAAFGAPHRRDRVFLVAYPGSEQLEQSTRNGTKIGVGIAGSRPNVADAKGQPKWTGLRTDQPGAERGRRSGNGCSARPTSHSASARLAQREGLFTGWQGPLASTEALEWWATEPDVGRVAHGVPARVDRLRGLGNAVVPQIAEWLGKKIRNRD